MSVELKLYEKPELTTDVKPGQIIEALPGARATQTIWLCDPIEYSPTNVFGYARGTLIEDYVINRRQGDTLVERIVPFGGEHLSEGYQINNTLKTWSTDNTDVYFVIGQLTNIRQTGYEDEFSRNLMSGSVTLSPEQVNVVRNQLLNFMKERGRKDYVFQSPEGQSYSLKEIVFSLREKK